MQAAIAKEAIIGCTTLRNFLGTTAIVSSEKRKNSSASRMSIKKNNGAMPFGPSSRLKIETVGLNIIPNIFDACANEGDRKNTHATHVRRKTIKLARYLPPFIFPIF